MAAYAVTLSAEQEAALYYETERRNAMRPGSNLTGAIIAPPQTPAEVLQQHCTQYLDMVGQQVQAVVEPLYAMVLKLQPANRATLVESTEPASLKMALQARLQKEPTA